MKDKPLVITSTVLAGQESIFVACLGSFVRNLQGVDWMKSTIFINIDPTSKAEAQATTFDAIAKEFVGTVYIRATKQASFPDALQSCWQWAVQQGTEHFFHLEGDWTLQNKVALDDLLEPLNNPLCYSTTLRYYNFTKSKLCLMPSVWKTEFVKKKLLATELSLNKNPEAELRERLQKISIQEKHKNNNKMYYNEFWPKAPLKRVLCDLGTEWKKQNKIRANGFGSNYTNIL